MFDVTVVICSVLAILLEGVPGLGVLRYLCVFIFSHDIAIALIVVLAGWLFLWESKLTHLMVLYVSLLRPESFGHSGLFSSSGA